jgi:hypothetical protein
LFYLFAISKSSHKSPRGLSSGSIKSKAAVPCSRFIGLAARGIMFAALLFTFFQNAASAVELQFSDYDGQGLFNNFSGDSGAFANAKASITGSVDTHIFHGSSGASLRIDYNVLTGFAGVWNSLIGKANFPRQTLNFTNFYGPLRNSAGNPSRVENVRVTQFSFWARGNGEGDFSHMVKVEFKSARGAAGAKTFTIPNGTNWARYDFPAGFFTGDVSQLKEVVFVIEDWRNANRSGTLYLDDLAFSTDEKFHTPNRWTDDAMLDLVSQRAFAYFLTFTDELGFALDRSTYSDMVSTGTVGFQLAAYCIGHHRGWADRNDLEGRVVKILQNLSKIPMGPEPGKVRGGYRGFYYHFLNAETGLRKDDRVELSLYDTTLLMFGVLTCKEYFPSNSQVQSLSQYLLDRVEWDWFVDHSPGINSNRFHLAWEPGPTAEGTFFRHVDGQTDEAFMVDVLALGSRTHPISLETYLARNRYFGAYPPGSENQIMVSWQGSLFNYFFASCWFNLESRGPDLHPTVARNIWRNDRLAILANRQFCIDHAAKRPGGTNGFFATYSENAWGLTACDNLTAAGTQMVGEYFPFGSLPTEENIRNGTPPPHAGTIAVYGAASSINFTPAESIAALRYYFLVPGLWSPLFGFGDAFSLDPHYFEYAYDAHGRRPIRFADFLNGPWVNHMLMGINEGPMLLAIENFRSQEIWDLTAKNQEISTGLNHIFGFGSVANYNVSVTNTDQGPSITVTWERTVGATEYQVFTSSDGLTWSLRKSGIKETSWTDTHPGTEQRFYSVKAIR